MNSIELECLVSKDTDSFSWQGKRLIYLYIYLQIDLHYLSKSHSGSSNQLFKRHDKENHKNKITKTQVVHKIYLYGESK